jgi:hypothetical protein
MIAGANDISATATTPFLIGLEKGVPYAAVAVKTLRRMRWETDIMPEIEKYLADQAQDLLKGAGEGRLNSIPDISKALDKELLRKAKAGL